MPGGSYFNPRLDRGLVRDANRLIRERRARGDLPEVPVKGAIPAARGVATPPESTGGASDGRIYPPLTEISRKEVEADVVAEDGGCTVRVADVEEITYRDARGQEITLIQQVPPRE